MNNERIVRNFTKFVERYKTYNTKQVTHRVKSNKGAIKCDKKGINFSFKGNQYHDFLRRYAEVLEQCPEKEFAFYEVPDGDACHLTIPIKFLQKRAHRVYSEDHVDKLVVAVNRILANNFLLTKHQFRSYLTERGSPIKVAEDEYYEEFELRYPEIVLPSEARYYVLDLASQVVVDEKIFEGVPFVSRVNKIIDTSVVATEQPIYGSRLEYLSTIYDKDGNVVDSAESYDQETLVLLFSLREHTIDEVAQYRSDEIAEEACNVYEKVGFGYDSESDSESEDTTYADSDDSVSSNDTADSCEDVDYDHTESDTDYDASESDDYYRAERVVKEKKKQKQNYDQSSEARDKIETVRDMRLSPEKDREIKLAKRLIGIMRSQRARTFKDWQRIGYALYSVSNTLFPVFREFSSRNKKGFENMTPQEVWKDAPRHLRNYSIDTIRRWAYLDNQKAYYRILKEEFSDVFKVAESCKHADLAKLVYALYRDRFVCVDIVKNKWYEFQKHKWVAVQSAYTLEELVSEDVRTMLVSYCADRLQDLGRKGKRHDDSEYKRYVKLMTGIDNLGNIKFRSDVIRASCNKFYNNDFQVNLDTDAYLVGFENGVYDLNEMAFRDGMPSDMVSKTVGYDYLEYDEADPVFKDILKFFSQVHTDIEMREYTLTFLASVMRGKPDQKAHIWTGGGGNGKSATIDLVKKMIGDYFGVLPVTILTQKYKSSSGPKPELADKPGKRFLVVQEPEHNDTVYVGQMKEITGEDTLHARPMYGDPFEYVPMFTIVLTCNNLPHIPSTDRGTWRRLRVTPYESEFVESNPVGPKQFVGDEELKEKFDYWVQPLAWLLLNKYYPKFKEGVDGKRYKIREPKLVTQYTNAYKKDSDFYLEFLNETFTTTDDDEDQETIQFVYDTFTAWYTSSYGNNPPPRKEFVKYLDREKIPRNNQCIKRIKYALALA